MSSNQFFTNERLITYLSAQIWHTQIGGKLGLHTDTIPKIWDGMRVIGAVPGVQYITTFMDGYTKEVHRKNIRVLTGFITEADIGTIIYQDVPVYLPKQHKVTYQCLWVKVLQDGWQYTKTVHSEGVIRTPWGAED